MSLWTIDDIRREIQKLSSSATYQTPNFYRAYTRRLKEILGDLKVLKGDDTVVEVDLMYANPERAIAKIVDGRNVTLPLMSLQFDGIEVDKRRLRPMENLVERKFWDKNKQRAVRFMAMAPVAANLGYVVNVWGKYIEEVNQLTEQLVLKFRPNLAVDITENEVYQAFLIDISEAASLTAGDREDRVIKRTVRFHVQGYIPSDVFRFTNTGEIESMNYEVYTDLISEGDLVPLESFDMMAGGGGGDVARVTMPATTTTITTTGPRPTTSTTYTTVTAVTFTTTTVTGTTPSTTTTSLSTTTTTTTTTLSTTSTTTTTTTSTTTTT